MDMDYDQHKSKLLDYFDFLMEILTPLIHKIEISEEYLTKIEYSHLGKN